MKRTSPYLCPLCEAPLRSKVGDQRQQTQGVTLWCPNWQCPAQEVAGYGKDEAAAFEIVTQKFPKL